MRRLDLDFVHAPRIHPLGWGLFALGLLGVGAAGLAGLRVAADRAALEAAAWRVEQAAPVAMPASATEARAQSAAQAALDTLRAQLNLPWEGLFTTLEALASEDVALLALAPDARRRQLRLQAEARDLGAMLAFHRRLEDSPRLRDVALVSHESGEHAAQRPVRFVLTANWVVDDAHP